MFSLPKRHNHHSFIGQHPHFLSSILVFLGWILNFGVVSSKSESPFKKCHGFWSTFPVAFLSLPGDLCQKVTKQFRVESEKAKSQLLQDWCALAWWSGLCLCDQFGDTFLHVKENRGMLPSYPPEQVFYVSSKNMGIILIYFTNLLINLGMFYKRN